MADDQEAVMTVNSFARTPLDQIGPKAAELSQAGWEHFKRFPDWAVMSRKNVPRSEEFDARDDVRRIMGDYWFEPPPDE